MIENLSVSERTRRAQGHPEGLVAPQPGAPRRGDITLHIYGQPIDARSIAVDVTLTSRRKRR